MRFLPDSAILGTLGRIKHASKKNRRGSAVKRNREVVLAQIWSGYNQDSRSFVELLAEAKRHAQKKEKAVK
jgi:hypothetical protein